MKVYFLTASEHYEVIITNIWIWWKNCVIIFSSGLIGAELKLERVPCYV